MKYSDIYLKFKDENGNDLLVSVSEIIDSGNPIDPEMGDDLQLVDEFIYSVNGLKVDNITWK